MQKVEFQYQEKPATKLSFGIFRLLEFLGHLQIQKFSKTFWQIK